MKFINIYEVPCDILTHVHSVMSSQVQHICPLWHCTCHHRESTESFPLGFLIVEGCVVCYLQSLAIKHWNFLPSPLAPANQPFSYLPFKPHPDSPSCWKPSFYSQPLNFQRSHLRLKSCRPCLFCLASFNLMTFSSILVVNDKISSFCDGIVFHCTSVPHFSYPFIRWWMDWGCSHFLTIGIVLRQHGAKYGFNASYQIPSGICWDVHWNHNEL